MMRKYAKLSALAGSALLLSLVPFASAQEAPLPAGYDGPPPATLNPLDAESSEVPEPTLYESGSEAQPTVLNPSPDDAWEAAPAKNPIQNCAALRNRSIAEAQRCRREQLKAQYRQEGETPNPFPSLRSRMNAPERMEIRSDLREKLSESKEEIKTIAEQRREEMKAFHTEKKAWIEKNKAEMKTLREQRREEMKATIEEARASRADLKEKLRATRVTPNLNTPAFQDQNNSAYDPTKLERRRMNRNRMQRHFQSSQPLEGLTSTPEAAEAPAMESAEPVETEEAVNE